MDGIATAPLADEIGDDAPGALLRPGSNVWRQTRARRAKVLVDAAAYYGALRTAFREARHSIYIVGWDVDSRTCLVDETGSADDDLPAELGDFLDALVRRRPQLQIRILLWDYSVFFADEREPLPELALRWKRLPQIDLCLDATVPLGAAHHQKIVVIDDNLAFCGGLDLTIRRWDDRHHRAKNEMRHDPAGKPYPPFHDVQAMVDGPAAVALAELVRMRWRRAACEVPAGLATTSAGCPSEIAPDFHGIDIGIARTEAAFEDRPKAREVEQLFIDMIRAARRCIYIESQYLTQTPIAAALAEQLAAHPALEVVIVCPRSYHGVLERQAMLPGRSAFIRLLEDSEAASRWLVVAPRAAGDTDIDVSLHSKVMIVDDRYLRIGSANLCNRSMATDSECDLVFLAGDAAASARLQQMRLSLIAEHCGCEVAALKTAVDRQGSLIHAMHTVVTRTGRAYFIGADRRYNLARIIDLLRGHAPDIIALQEVDSRGRMEDLPLDALTRALGEYSAEARTILAPDGHYGHVLLSHWPMHDVRLHDLSVLHREARFAIEAALDTPFGRLTVIAAHLGLRAGECRRQLERLHKIVSTISGPLVVVGDFNDWHGHVRHTLQPLLPERSRHKTFPARYPPLDIDGIYCRPVGLLKGSWIDRSGRSASDHLPVMADLSLPVSRS